MPRTIGHTLLLKILQWIADEQRRLVENLINNNQEELFELYEKLNTIYQVPDEYNLERIFSSSDRVELLDKDHFLYLWPITKGAHYLPVMTLMYDFSEGNEEARFRVALFHLYKGNPKASGYRFETSEGEGVHNYCHAQQIISFVRDKHFLPCEQWLPIDQPAFCLDADEPVSLLMSLLVSLYGFEHVTTLIGMQFGSSLKPFVQDTWWCKRNPSVVEKKVT